MRFARLRRSVRPLRRLVSWFALVREEESERKRHVDTRIGELEQRTASLRAEFDTSLELRSGELGESFAAQIAELRTLLERGVGARADATLSELWRRMEDADSRQATAIQRLTEEVERLREEQEVTNALLERLGIISTPEALELSEAPLRATVEAFRDRSPVVDLMCGGGEFLRAAKAVGIDAYGVHTDPATAEAGRALGLDVRVADPLDHLRTLESGSLGGVLCADGFGPSAEDDGAQLFAEVARALCPGGVVLVAPQIDPGQGTGSLQTFVRSAVQAGLVIDGTTRCAAGERGAGRPALIARKPA